MRPAVIALALLLVSAATARPKDRKTVVPVPDHFVIGRDTFFDFGPPFHYVELLFVNSNGDATAIERVILTAGYKCMLEPKVEVATASIQQPIAELFGTTNPCKIPEKDLHRELKRRKHDLVFSGANISMQVQCGEQSRIIRSDVLDRDMFDPHAGTPEYTSWTMRILGQLDRAIGPGVMDKPMITPSEDSAVPPHPPDSPVFQDIGAGKYDSLFPATTDKPSQIYLSLSNKIQPATVAFLKASPFQPIVAPLPEYPSVARLAGVEGDFTFTADVQPDGRTINFAVEQGPALLRATVEKASHDWIFPKQAAGQHVSVTVRFAINCHDRS
jgi:hypothetical protein